VNVQQLSIFLENRSGRIATITTALGDAGINIRAMSLADTSDFGILRLIVNDTERGREVLREAGFTVNLSDVIAVQIADRPGELGRFLKIMESAGLNVEYMYAFVQKQREHAVVIFRFDDLDRAASAIQDAGIKIFSGPEIHGM
jgi:hypothetical protein